MFVCPDGGVRGPLISLSHRQHNFGCSTFVVLRSSPDFRFENTRILRATASESTDQPVTDRLGPRQNAETS